MQHLRCPSPRWRRSKVAKLCDSSRRRQQPLFQAARRRPAASLPEAALLDRKRAPKMEQPCFGGGPQQRHCRRCGDNPAGRQAEHVGLTLGFVVSNAFGEETHQPRQRHRRRRAKRCGIEDVLPVETADLLKAFLDYAVRGVISLPAQDIADRCRVGGCGEYAGVACRRGSSFRKPTIKMLGRSKSRCRKPSPYSTPGTGISGLETRPEFHVGSGTETKTRISQNKKARQRRAFSLSLVLVSKNKDLVVGAPGLEPGTR